MQSKHLHVLLGICLIVVLDNYETSASDIQGRRNGRFLSPFSIVTFPNEGCRRAGKRGTCYSPSECSSRGGVNAGTCALGFGVCCTFTLGCGGRSRENETYVESIDPDSGNCRHTICPLSNNICQLRLDFDTFVISGPSTNTVSETKILAGGVSASGIGNSKASQCLTDSFSVTNTQGENPAPICGINSGQHMYVDVNQAGGMSGCVDLNFLLGPSTETRRRQWSIKVSQIACDASWKAPSGCTQYFLDQTDTVQTYNFDGGQHLANQKQSICVRRTRGQCRICWSTALASDFVVSGLSGGSKGRTAKTVCCGYQTGSNAGQNSFGYDCLLIPGAMKSANDDAIPNSRFCGRSAGLVSDDSKQAGDSEGNVKICSRQTPFLIQFISDGYEVAGNPDPSSAPESPNKGFRLTYTQDDVNCSP